MRYYLTFAFFTICIKIFGQNIGIGTSTPSATFHIKGQDPNVWQSSILPLKVEHTDGTQVLAANDQRQVFLGPNVTEFATFNISRQATSTIPHIILEHTEPSELVSIQFNNEGNGANWWDTSNKPIFGTSFMAWKVGNSYPLYLMSNGKLGINNSNPNQAVDVAGDVNLTGVLTVPGVSEINNIVTSGGPGQPLVPTSYASALPVERRSTSIGGSIYSGSNFIIMQTYYTINSKTKVIADYKFTIKGYQTGGCLPSPICGDSEAVIFLKARRASTGIEQIIHSKYILVRYEVPESYTHKITFELDPATSALGYGEYDFFYKIEHISGPSVEAIGTFPIDPTKNFSRMQFFPIN